jgi:predicted metal-dependent HD superfamily phosphohydrolase
MTSPNRWAALCERLGCPALAARFTTLEASYSEKHRRYHTFQHIGECLGYLDAVEHLADEPAELEFGIWLHDVVYATRRDDNEAQSAALAASWLKDEGADAVRIDRVRDLIMATRHSSDAARGDAALLQDIDLNVLGSVPARYDEYEAQIRQEYRWVPGMVFRRRRAELLRAFLEREAIYNSPWFRERLEASARSNLERALRQLDR